MKNYFCFLFFLIFLIRLSKTDYCGADPTMINTQKDGYKLVSISLQEKNNHLFHFLKKKIGIQILTRHGDRTPIYVFPYGKKTISQKKG